MKSQKISWPWGLRPRNTFGNLGPEDILAISLEPWFQFSQTMTLFSQESWDESNKILNSEKIICVGA